MLNAREEKVIFAELEELCRSSGYIHALAYLCFRDNTISFGETLEAKDLSQLFSMTRLVRTEISTLLGLMCKSHIDFTQPKADALQRYISMTDELLQEIHHSMFGTQFNALIHKDSIEDNPFNSGSVLREAIFYGGESAYSFQYRDLSITKYQNDNDWFIANKGFSIAQLANVAAVIIDSQNKAVANTITTMKELTPDQWSLLPCFLLSPSEIATESNVDQSTVELILNAFSYSDTERNSDFNELDDFNATNAYPILKDSKNRYYLFQSYSLMEAIYETPYFWFVADNKYVDTAMRHRGEFTESFVTSRLSQVFGNSNVLENVTILNDKGTALGEIDVLVKFADRLIIIQAKSKKLTIASRKGNDNSIKDDFKKAVQNAYNQGFSCAELLQSNKYNLVDATGSRVSINNPIKEIFILCTLSDHYPALSTQARQFLTYTVTDTVMAPFITDVFLMDVMTEILQTPLHFLSYLKRRTGYDQKILASHELTILAYHLKQNLWMDEEFSLVHLMDDICADLDVAMLCRREGMPGVRTPPGILTKYSDTIVGRMIKDIEKHENPAAVELGFLFLSLSGELIEQINESISALSTRTREDNKLHDITLVINKDKEGLTIHCSNAPIHIAAEKLSNHCNRRKYAHKANAWFGVSIQSDTLMPNLAFVLNTPWEQSNEMDEITKGMSKLQKHVKLGKLVIRAEKIGRNSPCPCGSGKKHKNCCL